MATFLMPAAFTFAASSSVIIELCLTMISPVFGSTISSAAYLPTRRSSSFSITSLPSVISVMWMPLVTPQSSSLTITSWATSTKRRVRYPESAVLRAVSAKPFLAPWVEIKYSNTVKPSRKLALIGKSIILPDGSAISPRIPAN